GEGGGEGEVGQGAERNVVGTPDTGVEHSTAQYSYLGPSSHIVDRNCFAEAPHAPDLDVNDAAGAQLGRGLSVAAAANRFIQADRRLQFLLQLRVIVEVVMPQRLLNHKKVEAVELTQVVDLVQRVRGIGVANQNNIRPGLGDSPEDIKPPSGLTFDFNPPIAGAELGFNFVEQLLHRILDSDGDAARDFGLRAA